MMSHSTLGCSISHLARIAPNKQFTCKLLYLSICEYTRHIILGLLILSNTHMKECIQVFYYDIFSPPWIPQTVLTSLLYEFTPWTTNIYVCRHFTTYTTGQIVCKIWIIWLTWWTTPPTLLFSPSVIAQHSLKTT